VVVEVEAGDHRKTPQLPAISPLASRGSSPEECQQTVDTCSVACYTFLVIRSFRHRGLRELFETGSSRRVRDDLQTRALRRLDVLDNAESLSELNVPGFNFHPLRGSPQRYSLHVNGPWCITFEWEDGDALRVDLVQYH
jgi:proteic killer suppression protein